MKKGQVNFLVLFSIIIFFLDLLTSSQLNATITPNSVGRGAEVIYNITINNTNEVEGVNFTQVNITLQHKKILTEEYFVYINDTNKTSTNGAFTQTEYTLGIYSYTVLSWKNNSLILNGTAEHFWFNATAETPGEYLVTITTLDSFSNIETADLSITVNSLSINFTEPTPFADSILSQNYILVNVTVPNDVDVTRITIYLYNSTGLLSSKNNDYSPFFANFTNLSEGTYYLKANVKDASGSTGSTETITLTLSFCTPDWQCTNWSACLDKNQIRSCVDFNTCEDNSTKPSEMQDCSACIPNWQCTDWFPETCPPTKTQARNCTDTKYCNTLEGKPTEIKTCNIKSIKNYILPAVIIIITLTIAVSVILIEFWRKPYKEQRQEAEYEKEEKEEEMSN